MSPSDPGSAPNLFPPEDLRRQYTALIIELGVPDLPEAAAAQLFLNNVNLGRPHYYDHPDELEIGTKNDDHKCLFLLDAIVAPYRPSFSCGLARTVRLHSDLERRGFFDRLDIAMRAGAIACRLEQAARRQA